MPQNTFPMQGVFFFQGKGPPRTPVNYNGRNRSSSLFWLESKWDVFMTNFDKLWPKAMLCRGQVEVWHRDGGGGCQWTQLFLNIKTIWHFEEWQVGGIRKEKELLACTLAFLWMASLAEIVAEWLSKSDRMLLLCKRSTYSLYHNSVYLLLETCMYITLPFFILSFTFLKR